MAVKKILGATAVACAALAALPVPTASAASNTGTSSIPTPQGIVEMQVTADCPGSDGKCFFRTQASLLTPSGPIGLPQDTWARQTIVIRNMNRSTWQEAWYSAPAGMPRELKGANHDNVLSKAYKADSDYTVSVTYFGGGPLQRFATDGDSVQTDWRSGRPTTDGSFVVCSDIQVVFGGVNVTTPKACAQTTFG
ncbi:MAG: hypothetical protein PGN27_11575 [Mycolicibacterium neoaurum]|uniref:hypothetical protein n=1 Tax=Mycolicibacterium neoaurum TaxID=1795 RepID=UPI002FFB89AD